VVIANVSLDVMLVIVIRGVLMGKDRGGHLATIEEPSSEVYVALEQITECGSGKDGWAELKPWAMSMYMAFVDHREQSKFRLQIIHADHAWGELTFFGYYSKHEEKVSERVRSLAARFAEIGGSVRDDGVMINTSSVDILVESLKTTKNKRLRSEIVDAHVQRMVDEYVEKHDLRESYFHACLARELGENLSATDKSNIGYVLYSNGDDETAKALFSQALETRPEFLIARYNLAMVLVKQGQLAGAIAELAKCVKYANSVASEEREASCLYSLILKEGGPELVEVRGNLDVLNMAVEAKQLLEQIEQAA
jgi:tetratricopeptide (TPR) repeat protein